MVNLKSCDIVYLVKNTKYNGELRYSLRSVCKNFPHRNIWFIGSMPEGIKPDYFQPVKQSNNSNPSGKYNNVYKLFDAISKNKAISSNFILFNDDFFVLKPVKKLPVYAYGSLEEQIEFVKREARIPNSRYIELLNKEVEDLTERKLPCNNFALHLPLMINKKMMQDVIKEFGRFNRSLYGNYTYYTDYLKQQKDVKIYNHIQIPSEDQIFVSTTDGSFNLGEVGKYIREKFKDPCEYEYE